MFKVLKRLFTKPTKENNKSKTIAEQYDQALKNADVEKATELLNKWKDSCDCSNSNCLVSVFCPECPFGGLVVMSGRRDL